MIIALKIDRKLLKEARVFIGKTKQDGHTPEYYDLVLTLDDNLAPDQYGNCGRMSQSVTKDERLAGVRLPICGNAKLLSGPRQDAPPAQAQRQAPPASNRPAPPPRNDFADDLDQVPF